jgi:hypothetical protein
MGVYMEVYRFRIAAIKKNASSKKRQGVKVAMGQGPMNMAISL